MKYFKPNRSQVDGHWFDSSYERDFYLFLKQQSCHVIYGIDVHYPIVIRPASCWFKEQIWRCDFRVRTPQGQFYLETKGIITAVFREQVKSLALHNPMIYERLAVITPKKQVIVKGRLDSVSDATARHLIEVEDIESLTLNCKRRVK